MPALKLPALQPSHINSLVSTAHEADAISISDNDNDGSGEAGTEDDPSSDVSIGADDVRCNPPRSNGAVHDDAGDHGDDRDGGYDDLAKHEGDADEDANNGDATVEEPQVSDQREDIVTYVDAAKSGNIANGHKDVITALENIRFWLGQLETELAPQGK